MAEGRISGLLEAVRSLIVEYMEVIKFIEVSSSVITRTVRENPLLWWLRKLKYDGLPLCIITQWAKEYYEGQLIINKVKEEYVKL